MLLTLAFASLVRHRARTMLAVLGVAVSAGMLLDMVMLSTGMRESFRSLLLSQGFQFRLSPKGTLPFDTEATIRGADSLVAMLRARPDVQRVSPVLGGQLHVPTAQGAVTSAVLGIEPRVQGDYELVEGRHPETAGELAANDAMLRATGKHLGDTLIAAAGYDPQLRGLSGARTLRLVGRVRFIYMAADQRGAAMPIAGLRAMQGADASDRISLAMVGLRAGANVDAVRADLERLLPRVTVISTAEAIRQVDERLSYFRQLAVILGAVSLIVGFLLVTTLMTVSVNERIGEIAVMRALGVRRERIVAQIVIEAGAIMLVAAPLGLVLGLVTARYLNSILARFPGLPERIDFFLFQPMAAWTALGLLVLSGILSGVYPSWRSASLGIATTLRQEAVG
ncbi:MAG TPA: FtsX-like permease family protein [Gemmatimonadaceae bacterium]|nr:FtsX-like permease family protein [Gemmatimonadaceae bacterium]